MTQGNPNWFTHLMATDSPNPDPESLRDRLPELKGQNILVEGPPLSGKGTFVREVLAGADDPLLITTTRSATKQYPGVSFEAADWPVIDCTPASITSPNVTNISSPGDLTGIGMATSEFIGESTEPIVALDSISSLLMYGDAAPVFRFLSVLTGHIRQAGGTAVYTVDDGSHPPEVLSTMKQLFDGTIELTADDEILTIGGTQGIVPSQDD